MKIYRYIATYKNEKKRIDLFEKDIEKAYSKMVNTFGTRDFIELHFSRVVNI